MAGDRSRGLRFVPWILHHFGELYEKFKNDDLSFDLRDILVYDHRQRFERVSDSNVQMCYDHPEFTLDLKWVPALGKSFPSYQTSFLNALLQLIFGIRNEKKRGGLPLL